MDTSQQLNHVSISTSSLDKMLIGLNKTSLKSSTKMNRNKTKIIADSFYSCIEPATTPTPQIAEIVHSHLQVAKLSSQNEKRVQLVHNDTNLVCDNLSLRTEHQTSIESKSGRIARCQQPLRRRRHQSLSLRTKSFTNQLANLQHSSHFLSHCKRQTGSILTVFISVILILFSSSSSTNFSRCLCNSIELTATTTTSSTPAAPTATTATINAIKLNPNQQNHTSRVIQPYDRVDLILNRVTSALDLAFRTPAPTTINPILFGGQKHSLAITTTTTTTTTTKPDQINRATTTTASHNTPTTTTVALIVRSTIAPTTYKSLDNLIEDSESTTSGEDPTGSNSDEGYSYRGGNNDATGARHDDDDAPDCKGLSNDSQEEGKKLSNNEKFIKLQNCIQARIQARLKAARRSGLEMFESMSLSGGCTASLMNIMVSLGSLKSYAFKFMDASAKIPSGVMYGLLSDFGDFDQCLSIRSNRMVDFENEVEEREFSGKYCLVSVRLDYHVDLEPNNTHLEGIIPDGLLWDDLIKNYWVSKSPKPFQMGVCVPSRCNTEDLTQLIDVFGRRFNSIVELQSCQDGGDLLRQHTADTVQQIILSVFATIILLTLIGSYLDRYTPSVIYCTKSSAEPMQPTSAATNAADDDVTPPSQIGYERRASALRRHSISISQFSRTSHDLNLAQLEEVRLWAQLLICFSIRRNWRIFIRKAAEPSAQTSWPNTSKNQSPDQLALRVIPRNFAQQQQHQQQPTSATTTTQCQPINSDDDNFLAGQIATDPIGRAKISSNISHHVGPVPLIETNPMGESADGQQPAATTPSIKDVTGTDSTSQLISSATSMKNLKSIGSGTNVYNSRKSVSALDLNLTLDLAPTRNHQQEVNANAGNQKQHLLHPKSTQTLNGNKIFVDPYSRSRASSRLDNRSDATKQLSQVLTVRIKADDEFWVPKQRVSLSHLSGLRLFVICWITMGMSFLYPSANNYQYYRSIINMNITRDSVWFTTTNYTLGIDMLLYMTGLVFVYKLAHVNYSDLISASPMTSPRHRQSINSKQIRLNSLGVLSLISKKILRFWPTYLTVIGMAICAPLISNGPMWPEMVSHRLGDACRQNWWSNVLFVNNFLKESEICLPSSWFVSVLMQLFVIGAVIIVLIHRYSIRLAIFTIGLLLVLSCSFSFIFAYVVDLPAPVIRMDESFVMKINDNIFRLYTNIFNNMGPFLIGMLGGLYLIRSIMIDDDGEEEDSSFEQACEEHEADEAKLTSINGLHKSGRLQPENGPSSGKGSQTISFGRSSETKRKCLDGCLLKFPAWPLVTVLTIIVLSSVLHQSYTRFWAAVYWSLHRVCWAICTGFLIHRCATYKWRLLHDILSLSSFIPVSRLIFITYLVFPAFIQMHTGLVRDGLHVTIYNMMNVYVTRLVLATVTALSVHLLVELPFCSIEEILLNLWLENISLKRQLITGTDQTTGGGGAGGRGVSDHHTFHPLLAVAPVVSIPQQQYYHNNNCSPMMQHGSPMVDPMSINRTSPSGRKTPATTKLSPKRIPNPTNFN